MDKNITVLSIPVIALVLIFFWYIDRLTNVYMVKAGLQQCKEGRVVLWKKECEK